MSETHQPLTPRSVPGKPAPGGSGAHSAPRHGETPAPLPAATLPAASTTFGLENAGSLVGAQFDGLEVIGELGRGGMGVVYKARQVSLERTVALKMLMSEHFQNSTVLARFLGEARAVAALDHPDIVKIYQIGQSPYGHYFAMEYIEGESLDNVIKKSKLPIATAASTLVRLALAVDYAHSKGVIHRDLKPANIMLKHMKRPVVMDFGIAKITSHERSSSVTQQGVVVGTPSYMAPEQATDGGDPVGPASDVYALGAILYAMLTARAPFEEKTALNTILKVISPELPPAISGLRPDVPEALERICMKCLAKKPADRYPSAKALADDLRAFRAGKPSATPAPAPPASPEPDPAEPVVEARKEPERLVGLVVKATGKTVRLSSLATVIGRSSECDIILRSSHISKRHCQILLEDDGVWIEDLDSANGTQVNGKRIQRAQLHDHDKLDVCGNKFEVRISHRQ